MTLTKQQWEKIQNDLTSPWGSAFLRCDGYLLVARVEQSKMKLVIAVYINGIVSGKHYWSGKPSETEQMPDITRRFWALCKKGVSARDKRFNERVFGKRECKKRGLNDGFMYTVPFFNTAGSFIRHIKKHNEQIEVLSVDEYSAAMAELKETEGNAAE
jgi:hypothetical protein